jgi:hypothetical protein
MQAIISASIGRTWPLLVTMSASAKISGERPTTISTRSRTPASRAISRVCVATSSIVP